MKKEQELNGQIGETLVTNKSEELITREKVNGTPFEIVTAEGKSFIALGRYRISDNERTKDELKEAIYNLDYDFLINVMFAVVDMTDKAKSQPLILNEPSQQ